MKLFLFLLSLAAFSQNTPYTCPFTNVSSIACNHNLNVPQVFATCYDSNGNLLGGNGSSASIQSVVLNSNNQSTITFSNSASGNCLISTGGIGSTGTTGSPGPSLTLQGNGVSCVNSTCTIPAVGLSLTAPVQANWTAFNVSGMSQSPTYANNRWEFTTNTTSGINIQGVETSAPSTPYQKVLRVWPLITQVAYSSFGVGWSDGTKYSLCEIATIDPSLGVGGTNGGFLTSLIQDDYTNLTTHAASGTFPPGLTYFMSVPSGMPTWIRLGDNGTNKTCDISWDGNSWLNFYTVGSTNFLSTTTELVVSGNSNYSNRSVKVIFDSFQ